MALTDRSWQSPVPTFLVSATLGGLRTDLTDALPPVTGNILLVIDQARFCRLLDRSEALQRAEHASAEKRIIDMPFQGKA